MVYLLRREAGSMGFSWCLTRRGGTKCAVCETEKPGREGKLDVSVSSDGS